MRILWHKFGSGGGGGAAVLKRRLMPSMRLNNKVKPKHNTIVN